ncbi:MAG: hypothetical protein OXC82_03775 [Rhodobacteraceae bacterium]|nr:hypothetical protein [Paracoccaceae bacterium]
MLPRSAAPDGKRSPDFQLAMGACTAMGNVVHNNHGGRFRYVLDPASLHRLRHSLNQRVDAMGTAGGEMVHDMVRHVGTAPCLSLSAVQAKTAFEAGYQLGPPSYGLFQFHADILQFL